jgi:hypothetical protein
MVLEGAYCSVPLSYTFFFLPGLTPARTFLAFSMSRFDQSRMLTPPTFCNGGASTVLAETCLCRVRSETPRLFGRVAR